MKPAETDQGVALFCDPSGRILQVVCDDLGLTGPTTPSQPFAALVDPADAPKALHFLVTLHTRKAAFDWVMNVSLGGALVALHFAGGLDRDRFVIIAARTRAGLVRVNETFSHLGHDPASVPLVVAREPAGQTTAPGERDPWLFDELMRLNNELATLQRELAKKNVELGRLNDQKNQLLGMAAHDLRNPLGVILSYSEFLEAEAFPVLTAEQRAFVVTIRSTSEFLLKLLNNLLDIFAIESGELRLELHPISLRPLIERNVALNRVLAEKKQIRVEFHADAELPELPLDSGKIEQVLNNFLSNACKFSHPQTMIEVRLSREGDNAVVSVRDQGQGIPAAELGRLFQPFYKTSVQSTAGERSTGLGLAIVRRIVAGHGGRVWVESVAGQGSTFSFSLPLTPPAPAGNSPP
jgi:signal transduction histidine kinase